MRRYRSYKFTNKHQSKGGVYSTIAAATALGLTTAAIFLSCVSDGNGANYLAVLGFLAIISCVYGGITGKKSFQEEECYYLFSWIGTSISWILVCLWIGICWIGFFM